MANQNDAVMLFVQDLAKTLQADPNEVIQVAQLNPEALKSAVEVFQQTQDIQQAAQAFQLSLQQLVQAAKHGAKLQYLKSLKNKCAEDEELYYFKKGGSIGCGCKKKEEGGKVTKTPEKNSSVEKFKNRPRTKEEQAKIDKLSELDYLSYKSKVSESNDGRTQQQKALKMKVEKKSKGSKMKLLERGSKCPKCGKVHSARMGCSVAEFKKKFENGGILKFLKGSKTRNKVYRWTNEYGKTRYGSLEEFNSWKKNRNLAKEASRKATKNFNSRPQVVRADRTAEGTQKPTSYTKYKTFKEAYNAARKNKDMYFDWGPKGKEKVYRSYDNANETPSNLNNNKADMIARYGAYLGWGKDPNFKEKSNLHVTDVRNGNLGKTTVEEEIKNNPAESPITNREANRKADEAAKGINATDFVDALSPTTAITNGLNYIIQRDEYVPAIYKSGLNPFGYAQDAIDGNISGLALRGVDAYATFGAPGSGLVIDKLGTRFAPRIGTLGPKSAYIPLGGTIIDSAGQRVLNTWNQRALAPNAVQYGTRSILRAAKEGILKPLSVNGGFNNAERFATSALRNPNTGTTYFYRGNVPASYDVAIDNAVKLAPAAVITTDYLGLNYLSNPDSIVFKKKGGLLKLLKGSTLPTAPKAEDRFRNGIKKSYRTKDYMNREYETKSVVGERSNLLKTPAVITRTVRYSNVSPEYNDTIYNETPERLIMRGARSRGASRTLTPFIGTMYGDGYMMDLNKNNASKSEYETLKRRFNTAWSLAK